MLQNKKYFKYCTLSGILRLIAILSISVYSGDLLGQSTFRFLDSEVAAGSKRTFLVPVFTGSDSTSIPISVFHGSNEGKILTIVAGVHGYEYAPILAAQKLVNSINPLQLKGTIILVHIANLESFVGRTPYVSPIDGINLNRVFPGNQWGTNTHKVAHFISEKIIPRSDYFIDIHSGDSPEDLFPYSAYYEHHMRPEASNAGKQMAFAMGIKHIVVFDTNDKDYIKSDRKSTYCSAEAFKQGIPSIDVEYGRLGLVEEEAVEGIENGILNILDNLGMQKALIRNTLPKENIVITNRFYISSDTAGIFYPEKKAGDFVKNGTRIGYITDYFGHKIRGVLSSSDGMILMILHTPPVNVDEDIAVIGRID